MKISHQISKPYLLNVVLFAKLSGFLLVLSSLLVTTQNFWQWFVIVAIPAFLFIVWCAGRVKINGARAERYHAAAQKLFWAVVGSRPERADVKAYDPSHGLESASGLAYSEGFFTFMDQGAVARFSSDEVTSMTIKTTNKGAWLSFGVTDLENPTWVFWTTDADLVHTWKTIFDREMRKGRRRTEQENQSHAVNMDNEAGAQDKPLTLNPFSHFDSPHLRAAFLEELKLASKTNRNLL